MQAIFISLQTAIPSLCSLQGAGLTRTVLAADVIDFFVGPGRIFVELAKLLALASAAKIIFDVIFLPNGLSRAVAS